MIILKQMMHSIWLQEPSPAYPGIHSTHTYAALPHKQILHFASDKFCRIWSKDLVSTFIYRSRKLTCLKDIGSIGVRLPHQHQHTHKTDTKKKKNARSKLETDGASYLLGSLLPFSCDVVAFHPLPDCVCSPSIYIWISITIRSSGLYGCGCAFDLTFPTERSGWPVCPSQFPVLPARKNQNYNHEE